MLQLDARGDLADLVCGKLAGSVLHTSPRRMIEAAELVATTRLRIPLLMADDCIHGHSFFSGATIFPTQLGMACTWDPALVERGARAAAIEIAATGLHWTFSPVLCIARDLRWGRVDETFGEDPHLIGELGAAMIRGYQGEGLFDRTAVLATAKHFAGYSETVGGRDASEADLTRRKLRSWFLPPFEKAARAGCRTFMLGYQAIDGVPVTANHWLLNEVLKKEWGFTGTLITDWDNVGRMVWEQKVCATDVEAATVAVSAGNDLVMNTPQFFTAAQQAVADGDLGEALIDDAVRRILTLKFELGLFEDPRSPDPQQQAAVIGCAEHTAVNQEMARRCLVLLRNDGTLPLDGGLVAGPAGRAVGAGSSRTLAIVGPNADDPHAQLGDWAGASGQVDWMPDGHPRDRTVTVLDGFREIAPETWTLTHARGADIGGQIPDPAGETYPDGQPRPPLFQPAAADRAMLAEAVRLATAADWVVAVVGDTVALTGEGRSTATLDLQGAQIALVEELIATGTPVIVVLIQSKPSALPESVLGAAAVIEAFNPGMQGGRAIAELVLGLIEPSGRLPITFARHAGQLPVYYNQIRGQHGDRYADLTQQPLFAFGEGLSFTDIDYSDLRLAADEVGADQTVQARVTLTNTGDRPSLETVQAYVTDTVTSVTWAERELKSFTQVTVLPGASVDVEIIIPAASCSIVNAAGRRVVEPGSFELLVGKSSRDQDLLRATFRIID
jgi:beta-glucosidase